MLLINDPYNEELLIMTAQGFAGYAQLFLEMDLLEAQGLEDDDRISLLKKRAVSAYKKALVYSLRALKECDQNLGDLFLGGNEKKFNEAIEGSECVSPLFWSALSALGQINLDSTNLELMSDLPKMKKSMEHVLEKEPSFYFGSPYMFFGMYYCKLPKMVGGDPEKGLKSFKEANKIMNNESLYAKVLIAEHYWGFRDLDQSLKLWDEVLEANIKSEKVPALINAVAKKRAFLLKKYSEILF